MSQSVNEAGPLPREMWGLRLVLVKCASEDDYDLVSVTHRAIIAGGENMGVIDGIPEIEVDEKEVYRLAGEEPVDDWPGWELVFDWLERKFPTQPAKGGLR